MIVANDPGERLVSVTMTNDGIIISVAPPDSTSAADDSATAPAALPQKSAAVGNEGVNFAAASTGSSSAGDGAAAAHDASPGEDVVQWLGLKAALEFLGL